MRWIVVVGSALAGIILTASGAVAADSPAVWLQPGDQAGSAPTGEAHVGCEAITIWAQGDLAGDGTWAALPVGGGAGSGALSVIGQWHYAGGPAAQMADVGALPAGRYRLVVYGALARERVVTVDCNRSVPVYAPVIKAPPPAPAPPLAATGAGKPASASATGDIVPVAELTTVATPAPASGLTDSPLVLGLLVGLLFAIGLVGWSFARR